MALLIYWYGSLLILLCVQETVSSISCLRNDTCSQCYSALVEQITKNDNNMFHLQQKFFPPNSTPPVFVIVTYNYTDNNGDCREDNYTIWYWSTSTFYLYHPIHVFQFTSLLFSDISQDIAKVDLCLNEDCMNASTDYMRLLTQRLKLYAMAKSINSPISDDYSPKAESAQTISDWTQDSKHQSVYVFSVFIASPLISWFFIFLALCYYNHLCENGRIERIKEKLSSVMEVTKANCKHELQNEYLLSLLFVIYSVVLSGMGLCYYFRTANTIDNKYTDKYYKLSSHGGFATSIIICTLILDIIIFLIFVIMSTIILYKQAKLDEIIFWKFCAYSMLFPFCILANHFHYIIIAFIHDMYHATGVAFVYGILIITVYEALVQLPKILEKCRKLKCPSNDSENNSNGQHDSSGNSGSTSNEQANSSREAGDDIPNHNTPQSSSVNTDDQDAKMVNSDTNRAEQKFCNNICKENCKSLCQCCNYYNFIFIAKIGLIVILVGFFLYNILIYHYLPINKALDDAANHLIGLYQAIAVFFAAVAAYLFFNKEYTSPISVFTKAEYEEGVFSGTKQRRTDWETFSAQKKDNEMAKIFLERLKKMTEDTRSED